jgi:hypothetical protein
MIDTTSARGFDFREHINHPYILKTVSADALAATVFEPITCIVPGYIVEGLTLLAGKPEGWQKLSGTEHRLCDRNRRTSAWGRRRARRRSLSGA